MIRYTRPKCKLCAALREKLRRLAMLTNVRTRLAAAGPGQSGAWRKLAPPSRSSFHVSKFCAAKDMKRLKKHRKNHRRRKGLMFNTVYEFDSEPDFPYARVAGAGKIFCAEPAVYLGTCAPDMKHGTREVAFLGRSNVGKSTLVGALLENPKLVRSSKTPGRTRDVHFFALGDKINLPFPMLLVDCPGYGFARAPEKEQLCWEEKMDQYLSMRDNRQLARCFILIDSRRNGLTDVDRNMARYLESRDRPFQFVLTKADCISPSALDRAADEIISVASNYGGSARHLVAVSSKVGRGLDDLRNSAILSAAAMTPV